MQYGKEGSLENGLVGDGLKLRILAVAYESVLGIEQRGSLGVTEGA